MGFECQFGAEGRAGRPPAAGKGRVEIIDTAASACANVVYRSTPFASNSERRVPPLFLSASLPFSKHQLTPRRASSGAR